MPMKMLLKNSQRNVQLLIWVDTLLRIFAFYTLRRPRFYVLCCHSCENKVSSNWKSSSVIFTILVSLFLLFWYFKGFFGWLTKNSFLHHHPLYWRFYSVAFWPSKNSSKLQRKKVRTKSRKSHIVIMPIEYQRAF